MRVHLLLERASDTESYPWVIDACDEYTIEEWNGAYPDEFAAKLADKNIDRCVLIVNVSDTDFGRAFEPTRPHRPGRAVNGQCANAYVPTDGPLTITPFTLERRLCDDAGMVSEAQVEPLNAFSPGLTYLQQLNNLRAHTGLSAVEQPFACTGNAHLAREHILCISPAHRRSELFQRVVWGTT